MRLSPSHPLNALHIAWIARAGAIDALNAAGVPLAGHSAAVQALVPVIRDALSALGEDYLAAAVRPLATADPLTWAFSILADARVWPIRI